MNKGFLCLLFFLTTLHVAAEEDTFPPQKDAVRDIIDRVNTHWQSTHPTHGDHFWNRAVYHTGNMAAYEATHDPAYLEYSVAWAEHNNWCGQTGTDPSRWKYTYGESRDYVLFGDNQVCFQVYADLYRLLGGGEKIARAREVMEYQMSTSFSGYWWWVDGFYMVMPVMTKLYNITANDLYLEKLHEYWRWGSDRMWDDEAGLYYRDTTYVYPRHTTDTGGKDFWARGDGWITAAFPRVLSDLPQDDPYREEYLTTFRRLAESLRQCQCVDDQDNGYWCRSLLEESYAPGYETSGTALMTYGLLWGVNNGVLDSATYVPVIRRAWNYLTRVALQGDGTVGYVQPIGSNAAPGTYMTASQTADFGVGAYLLACSEMMRFAAGELSPLPLRVTSASVASASQIAITLNQTPSDESAKNTDNYLLDGSPLPEGTTVILAGVRGLTIQLPDTLEYGRYTLTIRNLQGVDGGVQQDAYDCTLVRTVPLYANTVICGVTAIGAQSGNPADNSIDGKLSTRWSQQGNRQWIQFELDTLRQVCAVDLAWYLGDTRINYFDIEGSEDGEQWSSLLAGQQSSGLTLEMERYHLSQPVPVRYVRVYCNGASTTTWNSITEARVFVTDSGGGETAISATPHVPVRPASCYNLGGQQLARPQHGINIVKGKKILY